MPATVLQCMLFALSLTLNTFLLQLIVRKSSKELGLYKYLLFIFICNDIVYTIVHFVTHPVTSIVGEVFYMFSANFPERWIVSIFSMVHSNSFLILCFHFVYRHIAVASHEGIHLFRRPWFISLLAFIFIGESVLWFHLIFFFYATDYDTFAEIFEHLRSDYPNLHTDSVVTAHYWLPNGNLRIRPLIGTISFSSIMSIVLVIVVYSAVSTFVFLHNNLNKSQKGLAMQRQLYYTLLVQFSVPFFVMYVPVLVAIVPPLFHIHLSIPSDFMPTMFSVYPSLDAIVILLGVHDYRKAALALFKGVFPTQCTNSTTFPVTEYQIYK